MSSYLALHKLPNAKSMEFPTVVGWWDFCSLLRTLSSIFSRQPTSLRKIDVSLSGKSIKVIELLMWSGNDFLSPALHKPIFQFSFSCASRFERIEGFPWSTLIRFICEGFFWICHNALFTSSLMKAFAWCCVSINISFMTRYTAHVLRRARDKKVLLLLTDTLTHTHALAIDVQSIGKFSFFF